MIRARNDSPVAPKHLEGLGSHHQCNDYAWSLALQQMVSWGVFQSLTRRRNSCHCLGWKRSSSPPALLEEPFEILSCGDHERFTVDRARGGVNANAAFHATACLPQRAVRPRPCACLSPSGKQRSADTLSRAPDTPQKRNDAVASQRRSPCTLLSLDRRYTSLGLHGIRLAPGSLVG